MQDGHAQYIRDNANKIVADLCARLIEHKDDLVSLCIERAETIGVAEYGDTSFSKPLERLECEVDEELADAIFYDSLCLMKL